MMKDNAIAIGADIGGTHITTALVDLENKKVLSHSLVREKLDSHAPAAEIIKIWAETIRTAQKNKPIDKISLAIPGPFDYEEGICLIKGQSKYEHLYGLNVKELLAIELDIEPSKIILTNDAASFLQGEVFGGAAIGHDHVLGITLGTGLGTCFYRHEVAHNADLWNLPFKQGIAEDYLSTRWFTSRYFELTGKQITGVRALAGLMDTAPVVTAIFKEFGENLAGFLKAFIADNRPDAIIIGGNIARSFELFKEPLLNEINKFFPGIAIKTALLGEEAALMGAASYWKYKGISLEN
ncbi:ROK family protein [Pedobacter sp.]|uniref:ROK family protein n=1 Tax=Pedobacter sp. TaxID=1411316 RepID=UPI003BA8B754